MVSEERKICRYQCQVRAAAEMVKQLRREIPKCSATGKPDKCERGLTKELIKWSKRLELQKVKLRKAQLAMKQKYGEYQRAVSRSEMFNHFSKEEALNIIKTNTILRDRLSFREHLKLYNTVKEQKNKQVVAPTKINPNITKWAQRAIHIGFIPIPIPFLGLVVHKATSEYSAICVGKCLKQKEASKSYCIAQCNYISARDTVQQLEKDYKNCHKSKEDPYKCRKKILNLLKHWKQMEVTRKLKYDQKLRSMARKRKEGKK